MLTKHRCVSTLIFLIPIGLQQIYQETVCAENSKKPNVLLIMADDLGYSDLGCYGGEINTPNLDRLASGGIKYAQCYNTGRCWPTRASLLTGYYPHGIRRDKVNGVVSGGRGVRPSWAPLITKALRANGYRNYHTGKWHLDGMPLNSGFDHSYYLKDQNRFFSPTEHYKDDQALAGIQKNSGYYATTALGDHAIECITKHFEKHPNEPFFHYLAFTAPHFPLHALPEDIQKYRMKYQKGWDEIRQTRWQKVQHLGLITGTLSNPMPTVGPPYHFPDSLEILGHHEVNRPVPWDSLTVAQQLFQANKMAIHAAMIDCMDQQIGRVIQCLEDHQAFHDTAIFFLSDNGASAEIMVRGDGHKPDALMGSAESYLCLGPGWSTTSNTPFRYHKTWMHEGGTATPFIIHWKNGIQASGATRHQACHVVDLWPTILEVTHSKTMTGEGNHHPRPGRSLTKSFDDPATENRVLWWLHEGNRALRRGNWKIVAAGASNDWELYDLSNDRTETNNVAQQRPDLVESLADTWQAIHEQQQGWAQPSQ